MVAPSSFNFKMPCKILLRLCGSTATVGSSSRISFGLCAMPQAMFKRRSSPPESFWDKILQNPKVPQIQPPLQHIGGEASYL